MLIALGYLGGAFLGWSVGANDSANMFGTAVGSRMVRWRTAVILIAICVTVGAVLQGHAGIATLRNLATQTRQTAVICSFAAAGTVTLMSILRVPVSTSQMMVAAIVGVGAARGDLALRPLVKVVVCWVASPLGAMLIAVVCYKLFAAVLRRWRPSVFVLDPVLRVGLVLCGCYGAYALGANGVAVVATVFVGEDPGLLSSHWGALIGGLAIGFGALTYSKPVMMTVGRSIVPLDGFTALIAVLALAITVHVFAIIGVPVSTSQAIVGGLMGIGAMKGLHIVNRRNLARVGVWWVVSPVIAAVTAGVLYRFFA